MPRTIKHRLIVYSLLFVAFWFVFSMYVFYFNIKPQKFISQITPKEFGKEYEDIWLHTKDNLKLNGWFLKNNQSLDKAIIILHGYPADKGDLLSSYLFLHEKYSLLFIDFRYFGKSEGKYTTVGIKETEDVLAGIKFLQDRGVKKIGIFGLSMGGATALMTVPQTQAIKAIVSQSSYARLDLMAETQYKNFYILTKPLVFLTKLLAKLFLGVDIVNSSPQAAAKNIQIPVFIIHSEADDQIPFEQALILQEALKHNPRAEFWLQRNLLHGETSADYQNRINNFFKRYL